jgi:hypothetical protein
MFTNCVARVDRALSTLRDLVELSETLGTLFPDQKEYFLQKFPGDIRGQIQLLARLRAALTTQQKAEAPRTLNPSTPLFQVIQGGQSTNKNVFRRPNGKGSRRKRGKLLEDE